MAGVPNVSIIPYSSALLLPPPFGRAVPIVTPWGFVYWGISAAETAIDISKNGFGKNIDPDPSGHMDFKNPFKRDC